eukprot:CAMPEP_0180288350 /NCGR_PEP_ID=MMETSP0988-20121125/14005_1 /TAXON_ID=697907 /ORGANISM="non described non described, Strain CCMP2293" /LENGTH=169 /DNA_ID=CAMNT_0022263029 /DNA_START=814 /DNA_END=1320 /DNA_ORIENTATION=-
MSSTVKESMDVLLCDGESAAYAAPAVDAYACGVDPSAAAAATRSLAEARGTRRCCCFSESHRLQATPAQGAGAGGTLLPSGARSRMHRDPGGKLTATPRGEGVRRQVRMSGSRTGARKRGRDSAARNSSSQGLGPKQGSRTEKPSRFALLARGWRASMRPHALGSQSPR